MKSVWNFIKNNPAKIGYTLLTIAGVCTGLGAPAVVPIILTGVGGVVNHLADKPGTKKDE